MKSPAKPLLALAALLAVGPGVAWPSNSSPVRSLLEARHQNVVIQEWDSSCGAAALATLLRYQLGDPVTERTVALGMLRKTDADRVRGRGGFSLLDMKRYAETRGFAAEGYAGLGAGQLLRLAPAIVPIRSHAGDHFVVFRGVVNGQAILADPAFGNRSLAFATFESRWKDRLAFVVKPARGKNGNRLFAARRDLLRVEDDAARVATDDALPRPLSDSQLALAFALDVSQQRPPPDVVAEGGAPGARPSPVPAAWNSPGAGSAPLGPAIGGSATLPPASAPAISAPAPVTSILPSAPLPTAPSPIVISAPLLPPVSVSPPSLPLPSVTVPTLPALPPVGVPIGR